MRLLNAKTRKFEEFFHQSVPPYAILSHTWSENELTFKDFKKFTWLKRFRKRLYGPSCLKIDGCCRQALSDGLDYVWIDTTCIDKSSSAELSEAINSMFAWYRDAEVCYVYLADVTIGHSDYSYFDDHDTQRKTAIKHSRWFGRGWTLQELLAPSSLVFFDQQWQMIDTIVKGRYGLFSPFSSLVAGITGISIDYVQQSGNLHLASVAQKMSWAARRQTSREEDMAYCLLGLFNISMPLIYGEGKKAFRRLQEEIMKASDDHTLFMWHYQSPLPWFEWGQGGSTLHVNCNALATSPNDFSWDARLVFTRNDVKYGGKHYHMTNKGVSIALRCASLDNSFGIMLAAFNCGVQRIIENNSILAMILYRTVDNEVYIRDPGSSKPILVSSDAFYAKSELKEFYISDQSPSLEAPTHAFNCCLAISNEDLSLLQEHLSLDEIYPPYVRCTQEPGWASLPSRIFFFKRVLSSLQDDGKTEPGIVLRFTARNYGNSAEASYKRRNSFLVHVRRLSYPGETYHWSASDTDVVFSTMPPEYDSLADVILRNPGELLHKNIAWQKEIMFIPSSRGKSGKFRCSTTVSGYESFKKDNLTYLHFQTMAKESKKESVETG